MNKLTRTPRARVWSPRADPVAGVGAAVRGAAAATRRPFIACALGAAGLLVAAAPALVRAIAPGPGDLDLARAVSRTYQDVSALVAPGVVSIATFETRGGLPLPRSQGSGVVFRADGVIVTNAHVVAGADVLEVTFVDGTSVRAEVIGTDEESDLAVLRVPLQGLLALTFRAEPAPRVGEAVLAVGNPLGLGHTVTAGIVSGLGRALGIATYEDFLQTDASIHPGNSGGPLVDLEGRVVGINTAVSDRARGGQGLGFAIPARMVQAIAAELEAHGSVTRGYLGVQLAMVDAKGSVPRIGPGEHVGVESVYRGSPAELAGMRAGDIILAFGGVDVRSVSDLLGIVARAKPNAVIEVRFRRSGEERSLPVVLGVRPPRVAERAPAR
ncbi:MAG: trypsin-like peptidase domain-containing protein [Planctomycetota bacterium]